MRRSLTVHWVKGRKVLKDYFAARGGVIGVIFLNSRRTNAMNETRASVRSAHHAAVNTIMICTAIGLIALFPLSALPSEQAVVRSSTQLPAGCPNLEGVYEYEGRAIEGFPNYYRGLKVPLTLDRLLGVYTFGKKIPEITAVEIKRVNKFEIVLMGPDGFTEQLTFGRPQDRIVCDLETVRLEQDIEVQGDGAHNNLKVTRTVSLDGAEGIAVSVNIRGINRFLFFFTSELPPEEYRAVFLRKAIKSP